MFWQTWAQTNVLWQYGHPTWRSLCYQAAERHKRPLRRSESRDPSLIFCRLRPNPSGVPAMGRPWAHSCCGLCLSRPNGHILRHCGLHQVRGSLQLLRENINTDTTMKSALSHSFCVCKVPGHPSGEILQSGAVLHHSGRNLPGLPVHLQPHSQAPRHPLLPPATGNRPVPCHELLCARHQGEHRTSYCCGNNEQ